jgi:outer membrane protein assembly factor BamB
MLRELGLTDSTPTSAEEPPAEEPPAQEPIPATTTPTEYTAGNWELPPIRRGDATGDLLPGGSATSDTLSTAITLSTPSAPAMPPRKKRGRRRLLLMALMFAVVGGVVWFGFHLASEREAGNEADRFKKAQRAYEDHNFTEAATLFRHLGRDFPQSANLNTYRFLAEFSDVRAPIQASQNDPKETERNLERLARFAEEYKAEKLLEKHLGDLGDDFRRLGDELRDLARQQLDPIILNAARLVLVRASKYKPASPTRAKEVEADLRQIELSIAAHQLKQRILARLKVDLQGASANAVRLARNAVAKAELTKDPEVKALLEKLPQAHRLAVTYTPAREAAGPDALAEEDDPGILVAPALEKPRLGLPRGRRPVLALARGVLYALESDRGEVRWAVRVGADTTALPLWLPATAAAPDQVLVLSSDSKTLSGLDALTGATRWCRSLAAPCLGRPVLVADRVFVPTHTGRVDEVEVNSGTLQGHYDLGQPLTVGGARQPGTNLVYFAADNFCVYVLDVGKRTCAAVLYSGHPSGSLRSAPVVLGGAGRTGYLLLSQADGLDAMRLRTFALPVAGPDDAALKPELPMQGWAWFPPVFDGEKLSLVTDAGEFVACAIERRSDDSSPLVPSLQRRFVPPARDRSGRAQLAHADGEQFWVLAHGGLYRLQTTFTRQDGPALSKPGVELATLGSPLHAAQLLTDEQGRTVLYLVTQSVGGQACLATAVDAQQGEILWQRQLGLVNRGQPVVVGNRIVTADQDGGLFLFDATSQPGDRAWRLAGRKLAGTMFAPGGPFHLLASADGGSAYAVGGLRREAGPAVSVRAFHKGKPLEPAQVFALQAPLLGTPAVVGDGLILPLGNGILVRQALAGGTVPGPNWRAPHADAQAEGHVVALSAEEFLVTDGSRGLSRMFCDGKILEKRATVELDENVRIVSPPVVVPPREPGGEVRFCVADTAHKVTLLQGEGLQKVRQWVLSGRITTGPFVRGQHIGCILDQRRLVWLDPENDTPLPGVDFRADVVGEPQLFDGVVVVADQRGEFHALSLNTGQPLGPGYTLKANAAATAAPVAFGANRLFVPLTDGTMLLLSRRHFQIPLRGFPLMR